MYSFNISVQMLFIKNNQKTIHSIEKNSIWLKISLFELSFLFRKCSIQFNKGKSAKYNLPKTKEKTLLNHIKTLNISSLKTNHLTWGMILVIHSWSIYEYTTMLWVFTQLASVSFFFTWEVSDSRWYNPSALIFFLAQNYI